MARFIPFHLYDLRGLGLKANDKVLYAIMRNDFPFYMKHKRVYSPSIANLQEVMEVSRMTVVNGLKTLEAAGLITSHPRPKGLTTAFTVHDVTAINPAPEVPTPPELQDILLTPDEVEENPF